MSTTLSDRPALIRPSVGDRGTVTCALSVVSPGVELKDNERAVALAGLFELRITHLEDTAWCEAIDTLAEKLGGRRCSSSPGDKCTPPCEETDAVRAAHA